MPWTLALPYCLFRLIYRAEEQYKERSVIIQCQSGHLPMPPFQAPAKPTVAGLVAFELLLSQRGCVRHQIAKHKPLTLTCKGITALATNDLYFAVAPWHTQCSLTGRTDKELIILSLYPALMTYTILRHNLVSNTQVLTVFLSALIYVPRQHSEICIAQKDNHNRVCKLTYAIGKNTCQQQNDYVNNKNEKI
jgi:hypothetical protein